ncbi:hypothetical protein J6590_033570 [Homalodisca vitripennis]|nr:hypothetical protein J6590_033570 [Homalodisca vitripennis]
MSVIGSHQLYVEDRAKADRSLLFITPPTLLITVSLNKQVGVTRSITTANGTARCRDALTISPSREVMSLRHAIYLSE